MRWRTSLVGRHGQENLSFQAEVKQILHLVTHSLYSNKEIFLRELVSNASDACDKLRFEALDKRRAVRGHAEPRGAGLRSTTQTKTITISDNGIGMSADEAVEHLGTIAKSGTREFMATLEGDKKKDANLIGQFGVGFYSGFIVADRITVESRRAGLPAGRRRALDRAKAAATSRSRPITRAERGTDVILHLRDGEEEFLDAVEAEVDHQQVQRPHLAADPDAQEAVGRGEEGSRSTTDEWETGQQGRRAVDASEERHHRRSSTRSSTSRSATTAKPPLAYTHNRVEGRTEYTQLLYVPAQGAVRPVEPRQARRRQALRQARLHHGRRRGADAGLPALRQGRDRLAPTCR